MFAPTDTPLETPQYILLIVFFSTNGNPVPFRKGVIFHFQLYPMSTLPDIGVESEPTSTGGEVALEQGDRERKMVWPMTEDLVV